MIQDQQLVLEEKRFCDEGADAARSKQAGQRGNEMDEKNRILQNGNRKENPEESWAN
jgi:hypothetical protein